MEAIEPKSVITSENWQRRVLETAEYVRPVDDATLIELSEKVNGEVLELVWDMPDQHEAHLGRLAVLSPMDHEEYFPQIAFAELHNNTKLRKDVSQEFGDVLWYVVALLAEKDIDMPTVLSAGLQKMQTPIIDEQASGASIDVFTLHAIAKEPDYSLTLDNFPFSSYAVYTSLFLQTVDPRYATSDTTREQRIDAAANLIWATAYVLNRYCATSLQTVLDGNYQKLDLRRKEGVPQGRDLEDPRWIKPVRTR